MCCVSTSVRCFTTGYSSDCRLNTTEPWRELSFQLWSIDYSSGSLPVPPAAPAAPAAPAWAASCGRAVRLGVGHSFGTYDQILFLYLDNFFIYYSDRRPLWLENRSVSFSSTSNGQSHVGPISLFYCLIRNLFPRIYTHRGQGGPGMCVSLLILTFRRHLRHAGIRWRYSNSPPQGTNLNSPSYLTTDGQTSSLSLYQATIWYPRRNFLSL
jgi:hypothetical protein